MSPTTMTAEEVRALGRVSARTFRRWHHEGGLKPTKRGRYSRAAVEKFLASKTTADAKQRTSQMYLALALADEHQEALAVLEAAHIPAVTARAAWDEIRRLSTARLAALPGELVAVVVAHADASPGVLRAALAAHIRATLHELAAQGAEEPPSRHASGHPRTQKKKTSLESARIRLADSKTKLSQARLAISTGAWRRLDDVSSRLDEKVLEVRGALLSLPPTWAPRLGAAAQQGGEAAARVLLEQAVADASRALAGDPFL